MVYGTVKRCGEDVMQCSECVTCKFKNACSVDDMHLRMWMDYGMSCACYAPQSVWHGDGNAAI